MALDKNIKAFVVYVSFVSLQLRLIIHLAKGVQIALLLAKEVIVSAEYSDFADIFLKESVNIFSE